MFTKIKCWRQIKSRLRTKLSARTGSSSNVRNTSNARRRKRNRTTEPSVLDARGPRRVVGDVVLGAERHEAERRRGQPVRHGEACGHDEATP